MDLQITLENIASNKWSLLSNRWLATYLQGIKNTYLDFATCQKLAAKIIVLAVPGVMTELEDKAQISYNYNILPTYSVATTLSRCNNRRNEFNKSCRCDFYVNKQGKSSEVCFYFYIQENIKPIGWKNISKDR